MRISTKCSVAIHALLLIALLQDKHKVTSRLLGLSTGCNPVIIRNIMGALKKTGLIAVAQGSAGIRLKTAPGDISVWQVYAALEPRPVEELFGLHPSPQAQCPVGFTIYELLAEPYRQIGKAMQKTMREITLQDLLDKFRKIKPGHLPLAKLM